MCTWTPSGLMAMKLEVRVSQWFAVSRVSEMGNAYVCSEEDIVIDVYVVVDERC